MPGRRITGSWRSPLSSMVTMRTFYRMALFVALLVAAAVTGVFSYHMNLMICAFLAPVVGIGGCIIVFMACDPRRRRTAWTSAFVLFFGASWLAAAVWTRRRIVAHAVSIHNRDSGSVGTFTVWPYTFVCEPRSHDFGQHPKLVLSCHSDNCSYLVSLFDDDGEIRALFHD